MGSLVTSYDGYGKAEAVLTSLKKKVANDVADDLQDTLELRYGSGFAQWVMDRLQDKRR